MTRGHRGGLSATCVSPVAIRGLSRRLRHRYRDCGPVAAATAEELRLIADGCAKAPAASAFVAAAVGASSKRQWRVARL